MAVDRHQDEQRLRRRHDAADRMDRELLHDAVDRRGQQLQLGALLGLDQVLRQAGRLLFGLAELVEQGAAIFGLGLRARLDERRDRRLGFAVAALLDGELLLLLDQLLQRLEDTAASSRVPCRSSVLRTSTRCWTTGISRLELGDRRAEVARSASFCCLLAVERARAWPGVRRSGSAGTGAASRPAPGWRLRRMERGQRIGISASAARNRATSSCAATRSLLQMVALGRVHGRIELDQDVAGLDASGRRGRGSRGRPRSRRAG